MENNRLRVKLIFIISLFVVILFLVTVYLLSPSAKIKNISISGNYFLSDEYILEKCGIDYDDNFLFTFSGKKSFSDDELIDSITVKKLRNNCISLTVQENTIVGYMLTGEKQQTVTSLLLKDGRSVMMNPAVIKSLALIPFIDGFDQQQQIDLAKALSQIDPEVIYRISEIKKNPLSYDADMLKFLMDDGYIIYCNSANLGYLNNYFDIVSRYKSKYGCILIDALTSTAISISCDSIDKPVQE